MNSLSLVNGSPNGSLNDSQSVSVESAAAPRPQLCRLGDLLNAWQREAQARHQARLSGVARGPVTGFARLDEALGGCLGDGAHIVHGQPGAGKSAFALQVAAQCGCPCLFVSCEMAPLELLMRHTARATGTFLGRLKSGELTAAASMELVGVGAASAPQLCLVDATQAAAAPTYLLECARIVRGEGPHLLIVIDSVHSWAEGLAREGGASEYETLNAALLALRTLAHRLSCPILAVSERNRESMSGGGLSAGAGSRKIEYGAETVFDLGREAEARPDVAGEVAVKLKIAKNRHGAAGKTFPMSFNGALQRFREEAT